MTKREIFERIVETCAEVCNVKYSDVMEGSRKFDVVTARSIAVFWCVAAGFSVESLLVCTDRDNHNSIDSIKANIEEYWVDRFAYHMLVITAGKYLLDYAHSIGEDFDMYKPLMHLARTTGKYENVIENIRRMQGE